MTDTNLDRSPAPARAACSSALARIVGDVAELQDAWETTPVRWSGLGDFSDVFGPALADDLVTGRGLRVPYIRLMQDGAYVPVSRFTHRTGTAGGTADGVADPVAVMREFRGGATIVLRGLVRYCPELADFCARLGDALGIAVSAGAYITPAGSRGAGPHYDPMSVIVRQVQGTKHWRLQEPPTPWPRAMPSHGGTYETPVTDEFTLAPGDSLYLPRGVVHDCWSGDEPSMHITFSGDSPVTWTDVLLDRVREIADAVPDLRRSLRWNFVEDRQGVTDDARAALRRLADELLRTEPGSLADDVLARHAPLPVRPTTGQLAAAVTARGHS